MKRLLLLISMALTAILASAQGLPADGGTYYIYCDNDQPQYFYNNGGTLSVANSSVEDNANYLWYVTLNGSYYNIRSVADDSKYFGFKQLVGSPFDWTIDQAKANSPGNVTLQGDYNSRKDVYMVMKNTGAFDQASGTYNKTNSDYSSDYCFVRYVAPQGRPIVIRCNTATARGRFTLQGTTKQGDCTLYYQAGAAETELLTGETGNGAYQFRGFFRGEDNLGTSVNVDALVADTLLAVFDLDIFSQTYGEKWLRFGTVEDASGAACSKGTETPMHARLDITDPAYVWCFVGTADDYIIYNRAMGSDVALSAEGTESGDPTFFAPVAQAVHWMLSDTYAFAASGAGYVIAPVGTTGLGINSYGGTVGWPIKFWKESGNGSHWNFERVGEVNVAYSITGTNPFPDNNTRVAQLKMTIGNTTSYKSLTTSNNGTSEIYFLPTDQDVSFSENLRYRGFEFTGAERDASGTINVSLTADPDNRYQYLFYSNSPEGHPYRIPALACTRNGVLLAISDYRPSGSDIGYGEVDMMLRRSYDNGQTWTQPECIADGVPALASDYPHFGYGFGDAALVADRESDEVMFICVSGKVPYPSASSGWSPLVVRLRSHDGGETWTKPQDITSQFFAADGALLRDTQNDIDCYGGFFASGKILQSRKVKKGNYYRLYAAMLCRGNNVSGAYVVYSDDFGETWQLLSPATVKAASGSDEPKVEELPNGNIVLSGRKSYGRYFNVFSFADDTFTTGQWGNCLQSNQQEGGITVGANSCNGEILIVRAKRVDGKYPHVYPIALQSLPWGSGRSNVGIWWKPLVPDTTYNYTSELFSRTWNKGLEVSDRQSAYSTMAVQADGRIGFFYEEEPNGYCMVYVPLTLEQITGGVYRMYDPVADDIMPIENERMRDGENEEGVFDLSGRRVDASHLGKGIYITRGRKYLIR